MRFSLKTDSRRVAEKLASFATAHIEEYWSKLLASEMAHHDPTFKEITRQIAAKGYRPIPASLLASGPLETLVHHTKMAQLYSQNEEVVRHTMGQTKQSSLSISKALNFFWTCTKHRTINKTDNQIRKWKNPRKKAIKNFIGIVGNKDLQQITREDVIKFRDWWVKRIEKEGLTEHSANRDIIFAKNVLQTVVEEKSLPVDIVNLFKGVKLKERFQQTRKALPTEWIKEKILNLSNLDDLPEEAKWMLIALAETGTGPAELSSLLPQDIILDHPIPHIRLVDRPERPLKTPHRQRDIPLVGYALDAFRKCPRGFPTYHKSPDYFSSIANKYLRYYGLLPSKNHSVYSLRHSFQDRLLEVGAPDRIQTELMGHKFHRPKYGSGGSLEVKKSWMEKICLKQT